MKKLFTYSLHLSLLFLLFSCSEETVQMKVDSDQSKNELLTGDSSADLNFENAESSRSATNLMVRSIANTTWDFYIIYNDSVSWHADVTFYSNGTTLYDEPAHPGTFINYGTWSMKGNVLTYDLNGLGSTSAYYFTGNMIAHNMSGTFGSQPARPWSAIQY